MQKRNHVKRIAAGILTVIVAMTSVFAGAGEMTAKAADSYTYEPTNLLVNPDFEESTAFEAAGGSHEGNWHYWQNAAKATDDAYSGSTSAKFTGADSALEQDVLAEELTIGTTYVYTVWARVSGEVSSSSTNYTIGVKNYGSDELKQYVRSTEWTKYEIEFTYTSGSPRVYGYVVALENSVNMYIDNASLAAKSAIQSANIENGQLSVTFAEAPATTPTAADFSATYYVGSDSSAAQALNLTTGAWNADTNTLMMNFAEVEQLAGIEQTVTVNLTYGSEPAIQLDYTVAAGEGEAVVANLSSVAAENGLVTVVLDADPTVAPTASQFTWEYKVDDGEYATLSVEDFTYDKANATVTASFEEIRSSEEHTVTVKVTYGEATKEASFNVEASEGITYYVDSTNGSDSNDGTTTETAFASIDKLNEITFLPGDQILFKKGETFTGCFKPQGSGTEYAPITVGSYGDGDTRPVLQPGDDWQVSHIMSADAMVTNVNVNYVIQFYNVQYWEVSDLELYDPTPQEDNSSAATYCSGITIQGEDIGVLEHFYIDNVIIHGFHGPGTNIGKTSGGITMNVITNSSRDRSQSVPTQINDIRITNCEIYDVGRSGINFLTPWAYRSDAKWGSYGTGRSDYEWLPYEDFYLGNNYIHDIDGDGCIVDNCSNAVVENNLVTNCVTRLHSSAKMAVGLFNWNSDDTYFQFNEVYDIQIGGTEVYNDGQGIEIDALNDRTWVQYNYVHDNRGGFMMYCNTGASIKSFDGIVRYNISQNDYAHPRQGLIDVYAYNYGGEIYNNTFYLTDRVLNTSGEIFLFATAQSGGQNDMKFYNNIFYYDGEAAAANQFGDNYLDWQSNIFYGFTNLPENDNPSAPNLSVDPMLVDPGAGATGSYADGTITKVDLSCYKLQEGSPAINAGVIVEDNGGRDYFGNTVVGIPDIGAYESGTVVLKLVSNNPAIVIDQEAQTITVTDADKVTIGELLESLIYEEGVAVDAKRGSTSIEGSVRLSAGDVVTGTYGSDSISYTVAVAESTAEEYEVIPPEYTNATAGSAETSQSSDGAENVLDDNTATIWHTAWDGAAATDRYITVGLNDGYTYEISGYEYTPRQDSGDGGTNGIITGYEIYVSDDNATWSDAIASGTWAQDSAVKTVTFDEPVTVKYVKLLATASVNDFASAAEIRLIGKRVYTNTVAPTAPVLSVGTVTETTVQLNWTEATDDTAVVEYVLMKDGQEIATFDPDGTSYVVGDLEAGTEYTFSLYAVDEAGNCSEAGTVNVTTESEETEVPEMNFSDVSEGEWYYDAVQYVYEKGIMSGSEGAFMPDGDVTRAMIVETLYKMEGRPEVTDYNLYDKFADLKRENWWAASVAWALNTGVATGDNYNMLFNPEDSVTREQLATFLYRYAKNKGLDTTVSGDSSGIMNDDRVSSFALEAFTWAVGINLISGMESTDANGNVHYDLAPQESASRAQLAAILMRFCEGYGI